MKSHSLLLPSVGLISTLLLLPIAGRAQVTPTSGTLFYTTFSGGQNVHSVDFSFNGSVFSITNNLNLAATPGADGIVFTSDGKLAVGGQGGAVYKVDPAGGNSWTTQSSGGTSAYHMMADPTGKIWSSGIPGEAASYNSTLTVGGTPDPFHYVTGGPALVDSLSWTGSDPTQAFYTDSGPGGFGEFGSVNLSTGLATPIYTNLPAAHGMTYDSYTGDLILFGDDHITQIDPTTHAIVHDAIISGGSTWDQGTSDGNGHLFVANNSGNLLFMDLTGSKAVTAPNFSTQLFLNGSLDDIAPLSGSGSRNVPDGGIGLIPVSLAFASLLVAHSRKRKAA